MDERHSELIRKSSAARMDREILGGFSSTLRTAANAVPQEPLTLEILQRLRLTLPKPELWLSTRLFPGSEAMRVEGSEENFLIAHPGLWLRLQHHCERDMMPKPNLLGEPRPMFGIQIIEVDYHDGDSPEHRAYIDRLWRKLINAVQVALIELPDWLRSAPQFSKHG